VPPGVGPFSVGPPVPVIVVVASVPVPDASPSDGALPHAAPSHRHAAPHIHDPLFIRINDLTQ